MRAWWPLAHLFLAPKLSVHEIIPHGAVEITEDQWQDALANPGKYTIINEVFTAAAVWPPALTIPQAQAQSINLVNNNWSNSEQAGFSYMGKTIASDYPTQTKILLAARSADRLIAAGKDSTIDWKCTDNTILTMDSAQVVAMADALTVFLQEQYEHAQAIKASINAVTTTATDVLAIATW